MSRFEANPEVKGGAETRHEAGSQSEAAGPMNVLPGPPFLPPELVFSNRLYYLAQQNKHNTNLVLGRLDQIIQELRRLNTNDAQLTDAVQVETADVTQFISLAQGEITTLQAQITALQASASTADPVVANAITAIQGSTSSLAAAIAALQPASTSASSGSPASTSGTPGTASAAAGASAEVKTGQTT